MNTSLFRKSALDKMASPDDLDQALIDPAPYGRSLLVVLLLSISAALLWGWFGSLPVYVELRGALEVNANEPDKYSARVYAHESDGYRIRQGDIGSLSLSILQSSSAARLPSSVRSVALRPVSRPDMEGKWLEILLDVSGEWVGAPPSRAAALISDGVQVRALVLLGRDRPLAILIPELTRNHDR